MDIGRPVGKVRWRRQQLAALRDVRVVRRDLCYVVGLPLSAVQEEDELKTFEYFGKYGEVVNVIVNRNPNFKCPDKKRSCAVYVTYRNRPDARRAILDINDCIFEGRRLRASYGTTKYCANLLKGVKCTNKACYYLHERGAAEDSFTLSELNQVKESTRNLTCSALLGDELDMTDRSDVCLFGRTRDDVLQIYRSDTELEPLPTLAKEIELLRNPVRLARTETVRHTTVRDPPLARTLSAPNSVRVPGSGPVSVMFLPQPPRYFQPPVHPSLRPRDPLTLPIPASGSPPLRRVDSILVETCESDRLSPTSRALSGLGVTTADQIARLGKPMPPVTLPPGLFVK